MVAASISRLGDEVIARQVEQHSRFEVRSASGLAQRLAARILGIPGFESFMGCIIVINLFVTIVETDRAANEDASSEDTLHWTEVFGWFALALFVLELLMRLLAFRCEFWHDPWNVADFTIVVTDLVMSIVGLLADDLFPVSILRIFRELRRLTKLARVTKMLRVFPELRMLLAGLFCSLRAIFWGTLLLGLFMLVWSMLAVIVISPLVKDVDFDGCDRCPRAYSSVWQAALTFFQQSVCGDSWGEATIPIIEKFPITVLFFLPVYGSLGMAVMNLILGVVVNLAHTAYEDEQALESAEKALLKLQRQSNILDLCKEMDVDGSGELSREEVYNGFLAEGEFRDCVLGLGITEKDFDIAWALFDTDESGSVSYKEFVVCLSEMKTSDAKFMLTYVKHYITWMKAALIDHMDKNEEEARKIENKLQETLDKVAKEEHEILQTVKVIEEQEDEMLNKEQQLLLGTKAIQSDTRQDRLQSNTCSLAKSNSDSQVRSQCSGCNVQNTSNTQTDYMQKALQQVAYEIDKLRAELKDSLAKVTQRVAPIPAVNDARHSETHLVNSASSGTCFQGAETECKVEGMCRVPRSCPGLPSRR